MDGANGVFCGHLNVWGKAGGCLKVVANEQTELWVFACNFVFNIA